NVWLLELLGRLVDDANEVGNAVDHAAHRRGVLKGASPADLVETEPDQGLLLTFRPALRAGDLLDRQPLALALFRRCHCALPPANAYAASPAVSASPADPSRRRATISLTFLPRRAATARGFSCSFSASKVARTML